MWTPIEITFDESNEDGLAYIYFDLGNFHYFTLTFNKDEDDLIYLEYNEQTFSIESNNVTYKLSKDIISFEFGKDIQAALRIPKHINIAIKLNEDENKIFSKTLEIIFSAKLNKQK